MTAGKQDYDPDYHEAAPSAEEIGAISGAVLLEFGAPWCGHCIAAQPAVREAMGEVPGLFHIKVYDGKGKPLGRQFRVKLWPTLVLMQDGVEVARLVRPTDTEAVRDLLQSGSQGTGHGLS